MESISDIEIPNKKIYTDRAIWIGTFLGGPLIGGYFMSENFKAFHEKDKSRNAIVIAIGFTILLFTVIFLIPENIKIPNYLFPIFCAGVVAFLVQKYQGENIKKHLDSRGEKFGGWRIFIATLIGCFVTLAPIVFASIIIDQTNLRTKTYGNLKHEILFYANNISDNEVNEIAHALTKTDFFGNERQMSIFAKKEDELLLVVIVPLKEDAWNDQSVIAFFRHLQSTMQQHVAKGRIVIDLSSEQNPDHVKMRIE